MRMIITLLFMISISASAQDYGKIILDQRTNKPMLIGKCTREAFNDSNFSSWFDKEYTTYIPDSNIIKKLSSHFDYEAIIILGTWCSDSRREVPRFFKILDLLSNQKIALEIHSVNRGKDDQEGFVKKFNIELVPTFIIIKNKEEIGRIVETPLETLEIDLLNRLNKN